MAFSGKPNEMRFVGAGVASAILLWGCGGPADNGAKSNPPALQEHVPEPAVAEVWKTRPAVPALPPFETHGRVEHDGARIWYATYGAGPPVILLHGAFESSESFGYQVPALIKSGHRVILIDSRGQGHSTRDARPYSYELMESDVVAVMDALKIDKAAVVGWSDGAIIGLIMAMKNPERVTRVFAFGANMDLAGVVPDPTSSPIFTGFFEEAAKDYARLSDTPDGFPALADAISQMLATQPNYTAENLAAIHGPAIAIVDGEHEEIIKPEHTEYLASSIAGARLIILPGVSHWGPIQKPDAFNDAMLRFLDTP